MGMIDNNGKGKRERVIKGKGWGCLGKNKTRYKDTGL